jgi:hypothetical protein
MILCQRATFSRVLPNYFILQKRNFKPDEKQEFIEKAKLIASVLDESLSNLIATYLENYVKSHREEFKAIERLKAKARRG